MPKTKKQQPSPTQTGSSHSSAQSTTGSAQDNRDGYNSTELLKASKQFKELLFSNPGGSSQHLNAKRQVVDPWSSQVAKMQKVHRRRKAHGGVALKNRRGLAAGGKDGRKRKAKPKRTFKIYIFKLLKEMTGGRMSISSKAMNVMNSIVDDLLEKLGTEAGHLAKIAKKQTMGLREVEAATKLCLSGLLRQLAVSEGHKAVDRSKQSWKDC